MERKNLVWLLITFALTTVSLAEAQQSTKTFRIVYLSGDGATPPQALVQALRDLGYIEGENINLTTELTQSNADIIIADGTSPTLAAKKASSTIPIVMMTSTDPVANGLV